MDKKSSQKHKKKMNFSRFTNLLYEASSSLVPGTGGLDSTKYTGDIIEEETKNNKG